MGRHKKYPITISWARKSGRDIPLFFDEFVHIMDAPVDFFRSFSLDVLFQVDHKTVKKWCYHLKSFFSWCLENNIAWAEVRDKDLSEFKYYYKDKILSVGRRSTTESSALKSTNHCLRTVYKYFSWCQENGYVGAHTIGKGKEIHIRSDLPYKDDPNRAVDCTEFYPLCFKGIGENSRTNPKGYFMTFDNIESLSDYFFQNNNRDTAMRNQLALAISTDMAWRVESLASLTVDQFSADEIYESDSEYILITPSKQKFGYKKPFKMPYKLALRVMRYIENIRDPIMVQRDWTEKQAQGALFLNMRKGTPLSAQSLSDVFTDACKLLGLPPGSGIHAIRRKGGQDISDATVDAAFERGDTPRQEDVEFQAMQKLGHNNIGSQARYRQSLSKSREKTTAWNQYERLREAERKILELEAELANIIKKG